MKYALRIIGYRANGSINIGKFANYKDAKALADAVVALASKAESHPLLSIRIEAEERIVVEEKPEKEAAK